MTMFKIWDEENEERKTKVICEISSKIFPFTKYYVKLNVEERQTIRTSFILCK